MLLEEWLFREDHILFWLPPRLVTGLHEHLSKGTLWASPKDTTGGSPPDILSKTDQQRSKLHSLLSFMNYLKPILE